MIKTYEFYETKFGLSASEVQKYLSLITRIEKGKGTEVDIRSLGEYGLKICICEGKYETFKRLVSPIPFSDKKGNRYYKYLLDAISLGLVEFIQGCPESLMQSWVKFSRDYNASIGDDNERVQPVPIEYAVKNSVMLYPPLKKELLDSIFKLEKEKIMQIRIKDVKARQISGMGHPIRSVRDVIYYAESPVVYACIDLFSKNIVTTANDTGGCYDDYVTDDQAEYITNIIIDYDSLDEFNKKVADELVKSGYASYSDESYVSDGKSLILEVPCKRNDYVSTVNAKFMEIVSKFHKQDMIYGKLSVEDIAQTMNYQYVYLTEEEKSNVVYILEQGYTSENILKALKYFAFIDFYYDSQEDIFWRDKTYYQRHKEYLESGLGFGGPNLQ